MAQFTTTNNNNNNNNNNTNNSISSNLVGKELSIASSFVKQYYTLLNKAPCFIYNFYSHDSTFIHGTIEMANEHYTEPIVGRDKIKKKMSELNLNDCRAKIKQIDCLETLAGGLVIQVIGELSTNGSPMRRFLQTFVLAPSPDESRQDGDSAQHENKQTNNGSLHNQKFYVLNSIFRYQDDAPENDFDDEVASASSSSVSSNNATSQQQQTVNVTSQQQPTFTNDATNSQQQLSTSSNANSQQQQQIQQQPTSNNATSQQQQKTSNGAARQPQQTPTPAASTTNAGHPPSNEPKTWANMVRNAHPATATSAVASSQAQPITNKSIPNESQQTQQPQQQQQSQQSTNNNNSSSSSSNNNNGGNNNNNGNGNNANNRRRHLMRKPANKTTGRMMKNKPTRFP